jgi:hypothetical protein
MKQEEIQKYNTLSASVFVDLKSGVLDAEEYREFMGIYGKKCEEAQQAAERLKQNKSTILAGKEANSIWVEAFKKNRNIAGLSRKLVVSLIEWIHVYPGSRVEIRFRYQSEYERAQLFAENAEKQIAEPSQIARREVV